MPYCRAGAIFIFTAGFVLLYYGFGVDGRGAAVAQRIYNICFKQKERPFKIYLYQKKLNYGLHLSCFYDVLRRLY